MVRNFQLTITEGLLIYRIAFGTVTLVRFDPWVDTYLDYKNITKTITLVPRGPGPTNFIIIQSNNYILILSIFPSYHYQNQVNSTLFITLVYTNYKVTKV